MLHSPQDFAVAMERLCGRVKQSGAEGGEHLCFIGSGRDQEDQYLHMAVAKFLQRGVANISIARGGFLGKLVDYGRSHVILLQNYGRCSVATRSR